MWQRFSSWRWAPGLVFGLWLGRVLSEGGTAVSDQATPLWLAVLLTLALAAIGSWQSSRWPLRQTWPALLLFWYLFWPEMSGVGTAVSAGVVVVVAIRSRFPLPAPRWWGIILSIGFFSLYWLTLAPDVLPADNGEFQLVAAKLGVAHPPGFPLYTLLGYGMTRLPGAMLPAVKVNLLSVITSSLTLWLVYETVWRLTRRVDAGVTAVIALGTAVTFWAQATTANIRSLTAFFATLMLYALIRFYLLQPINTTFHEFAEIRGNSLPHSDKWLMLFAAAAGWGMTHHPSLIFMGVAFVGFIVWCDPSLLRQPRRWIRPFLAAASGLIPLIYLPLRAHSGAPGASPGLAAWDGFWDHVLARGFSGDFFYFIEPGILVHRLRIMADVLAFQVNGWLLAGMVAGLLLLVWRERKLAFLLGGSLLLHAFITATYRAPQSVEYMMPAYIPAVILLGTGIGLFPKLVRSSRLNQFSRELTAVLTAVFTAILLIAALGQGWQRWPSFAQMSQSHDARDYAAPLLAAAPAKSIILADWHWATPLWYLQEVEGRRPDVTVEFVYPRGEPYGETWVRRIGEELAHGRPVISTHFNADDFASLPPAEPLGEAFYYRQTPRTAVSDEFSPLDLTLGDTVQVLGYKLSTPDVEIGGEATLTMAWQPIAELGEPLSLFAHGIGGDGRLYAQQDVPAIAQPDGITLTQFRLTVRPGAAPGELAVVVGAYGREPLLSKTGETRTAIANLTVLPMIQPPATQNPTNRPLAFGSRRLIGFDWDNTLPQQPRLYLHWQTADGYVTEVQDNVSTFSLPPTLGPWGVVIHNSQFTIHNSQFYIPFGQGIVWTGMDVNPITLTQSPITITPRFLSGRPLWRDWVVSVRLVGFAQDGFHWAWWDLDDSVPAMGAIPSLKWIGDTAVRDPHRLEISADAFSGQTYGILLGMYDAFTSRQLPILDERVTAVAPWVEMKRGQLDNP